MNYEIATLGWACRFNSPRLGWMVGSHRPTRCRRIVLNSLHGVRGSSLLGWIHRRWVGLNLLWLGWVGFAVVGSDIHHGFHSLSLGCIHQVGLSLSPSGLVGFHSLSLGWIGWVGLDLSPLGWICHRWVGFAVVGLYSSLLGSHSPSSGYIRPRCAQFSLTGPLANIGCIGFTIVDPTCRCWVQPIAVGLVGCDCDCFSLARVEELCEMTRRKTGHDFRHGLFFVTHCWVSYFVAPRIGISYPWRFPFPLISSDLGQPRKSGVAHIPHRRGGARVGYVFTVGSGSSWESQPTSQERGGEDGRVEVWRFVVRGKMVEDEREINHVHGWFRVQTPPSCSEIGLDVDAYSSN